jgi:hypothetical protein
MMDTKPRRSPLRRLLLGGAALALLGGHAFASGCAADFAPISKVDGLRVLSVVADHPYVTLPECASGAGCDPAKVTLNMTWADGQEGAAPPMILWIGGCFDPVGDQYYGCYDSLGKLFSGSMNASGKPDIAKLLASGYVGIGPSFTLTLPQDLITRRPKPAAEQPYYGIAYVFFAVCAGELRPTPADEASGLAGNFPISCYDQEGNRLGADRFVPGYTQVYAFADGRGNANPVIEAMTLDAKEIPADPAKAPEVEACSVTEDERLKMAGCGRRDAWSDCTTYDVSVKVPEDVAEIDPSGKQADGTPVRETVWIDYFTDRGDFAHPTQLVSDAVTGYQPDHSVPWVAPPEPGPARIWAVVHDNRGGQAVIERTVMVK